MNSVFHVVPDFVKKYPLRLATRVVGMCYFSFLAFAENQRLQNSFCFLLSFLAKGISLGGAFI